MCLAAPARIVALEPDAAVVELNGHLRRASLAFQPEVAVGDWALVAAGSVVRRIDRREADELRRILETGFAGAIDADQHQHHHGQGEPR
jgi:hydrogenase assembly chaperone HypC/HupF